MSNAVPMRRDTLTPEQVADGLQLHVVSVRRMIREGRIKAVRIGTHIRVARCVYENIVANGVPTIR